MSSVSGAGWDARSKTSVMERLPLGNEPLSAGSYGRPPLDQAAYSIGVVPMGGSCEAISPCILAEGKPAADARRGPQYSVCGYFSSSMPTA